MPFGASDATMTGRGHATVILDGSSFSSSELEPSSVSLFDNLGGKLSFAKLLMLLLAQVK